VLASVHPQAALEVFEKDCLISLGTCIAPRGQGRPGRTCFRYTLSGAALNESVEMLVGDVKLLRLPPGQTAQIVIEPARGFDAGAGPRRRVTAEVRGGTVGLILDARGRPLTLPTDPQQRRDTLVRQAQALQLYAAS